MSESGENLRFSKVSIASHLQGSAVFYTTNLDRHIPVSGPSMEQTNIFVDKYFRCYNVLLIVSIDLSR